MEIRPVTLYTCTIGNMSGYRVSNESPSSNCVGGHYATEAAHRFLVSEEWVKESSGCLRGCSVFLLQTPKESESCNL